MLRMIIRRLVSGLGVLIVVAVITFLMLYITAGDVGRRILGDQASEDAVAAKNEALGLNESVFSRLGDWFSGAIRGDFGKSWFTNEPVFEAISNRLDVTLVMVVVSITIIAVVATVVGVAAAVKRGWIDRMVQIASIGGSAIPGFVIGVVLVNVFAVKLGWFAAISRIVPGASIGDWVKSLTLPVIALVINGAANAAAQIRSAVIKQLEMDYVRTLRSRGISEREVLFKHVLRSAAPAGLTVLSLQFIGLLGGVVVIESIFAIAGMGRLAVDATTQGDLPIVMGVVIYTVVIVIIVNLLVDIANGWLNPKVRTS